MKRRLAGLAFVAVAVVANATFPKTASATGSWEDVCCGTSCGYADYCLGNGNKTCCKIE